MAEADRFEEGAPCWADVTLPDLEAGKRFYGALFGWTFGPAGPPEQGRRTEAFREGYSAAALAAKSDGRMPTVWTVHFAVRDADAVARRVKEAGGQLVRDPFPVMDLGTAAHAADPEGAVFGLWQAKSHSGFGTSQEPGAFCWAEVYSRDPATVDPFYESVFRYVTDDLPEDEGVAFRTWSLPGDEAGPGTAVGGRSVVSGAVPEQMPSHFLVYFRVEDCDATAEAAVRLGGRIRNGPLDIPHGRIAVLSDDQGAVFAVLQDM